MEVAEGLLSRKDFPCRNKGCLTEGIFGRDIGFKVATKNERERKPHVATEFFCVAIEDKGSKELYVATRLFTCHDREVCRLWKLGRDMKILGHD